MKIKVEELKTILNNLKAGLSSGGETTDQSSCFAFTDGYIRTYNDEVAVTCPFDSEILGAVSAKELLALVGKLKGEEVEISKEEDEIRLKSGRSKAGIRFQTEILMPLEEIRLLPKKSKKWNKIPACFKPALKSCLFSASKDMSNAIITVVHCVDDKVESTDNDRATICTLEKEVFKNNILIPAEAGKLLVDYSNILAYDDSQEGWLHFLVDSDTIFSCRTLVLEKDESYPDLEPHFEVEGSDLVFPASTKEILDRAGVFVETDFDQDKFVEISISSKGMMKIRAEGDTGWFEETARVRGYKGEEASFNINPQYLQQILSSMNTAVIGEDRVLFKTGNFQHIVALGE